MSFVREMVVEELMPCLMMVTMEACTIGLTIMCSIVMGKGMSPFVFVVYTNALSSIIFIIPSLFTSHRNRRQSDEESDEEPLFTLPLLTRFFLLGLTGVTLAQNLAFVGLSYSSPIITCGMTNLIPTLSFLLSTVVLRENRFDLGDSSSKVKIVGSILSIIGAVSITLYKGPVIRSEKYSYSPSSHLLQIHFLFSSSHEHWVIGSVLLATASLAFSIWNIIQIGTIKQYPYAMKIGSAYTVIGTIQTTILAVILERNLSAWRLKLDMELLVIVLHAIFGSVVRSRVQNWCAKVKGPQYVALFKPLGIPIATFCGCLFFSHNFHYGSIFGVCIVGMGYYTMMWGQIREHEAQKNHKNTNSDFSDTEAPLLEGESQV